MKKLALGCFGAALLACTAATSASAMPVAPLSSDQVSNVEQARWVCNVYGRCFWRPNYYAYSYGAYGYPYRRYGFYRPYWGGGWGYRRWRRW